MLTFFVRVNADYYTMLRLITFPPVDTMAAVDELAHQFRNSFMVDKFVIENGITRRYGRTK